MKFSKECWRDVAPLYKSHNEVDAKCLRPLGLGLDDLCVRFIINLPREELESVERICFQVEEAQWFYEDFIRPLDPALPSLSLKAFALRIFQHCPLMSQWSHYHHITAFSEFLAYKTRVPVRGAIMLNQDMDEVVLVKGWKKGANWSFPRGKINKGEKDLDCAIREVYEETGFDVRQAGLVKDDENVKFIEITMREQHMRLYVFRGVPQDTHFEPRTRKEISKIEWYKLSELPTLMKKNKPNDESLAVANANKFYMVAPFMHPLKKWIAQQKRLVAKTEPYGAKQLAQVEGEMSMDEAFQPIINNRPTRQNVPSDLPEVTLPEDASSHLKRLLNINSLSAQNPLAPSTTLQADTSKSNALLQLLRSGSSREPTPQAPAIDRATHPNAVSGIHPPTHQPESLLAPNFFPGFPQQFNQADQPENLPRIPRKPYHGTAPPSLPMSTHPYASNEPSPPFGYHGLPQFQNRHGPEIHALSQTHRPAPAPAPYQQTGDPQFSQPAHAPQIQGATVPPASNLPPPKLTSHSLALLNVFKDNSTRSPQPSNPSLVQRSEQTIMAKPKTLHHQDQLLGLLKGAPPSAPAELSAQPVSPAGKRILQRSRAEPSTPKRSASHMSTMPKGDPRTSATASGAASGAPNVTHPEPNFRGPVKKMQNGSNRKNKDRQTQPLASPITILSRPQSGRKESSPTPVISRSPKPPSRASSQPRTNKPKAAEPSKPFQPQILRRSDNLSLDNILPTRSKDNDGPSQQTAGPPPNDGQGTKPAQANFDRRPSQTVAQKETLLSLFGKRPVSPLTSPAVKPALHSSVNKPSAPSSAVSSLSPVGAPSELDTEINANKVSSPVNKAFLLGFLEGVAKGNK
ncbi:decapping enzyme complex catalytic subunit DCP2 [Aspergillus clavatus NRRL 1]|uniref:Decapping enzyme Dcp2, putative n=1 Tax=Aspergillus clavatus (strain ATCC 1007 / CBS 513.65 / DSM 816 / NCTC 3887 / NRRL 1 / QM 1276 / 107) TaxID=344612 RepID=A1CBI8_ASPCL|nr:decapping enzyme Dcp2, putative [Aspergillus clavatus NRRL 1]EAW13106.1 decapping enzyme Dcp2, putative [Aspergillus clavatus NRRL 1]